MPFHAHARQKRHALVVRHHAADGLHSRHLDIHVKGHLVPLEFPHHHIAVRRDHIVRDERFAAQLDDGDALASGERVSRRNNEHQ